MVSGKIGRSYVLASVFLACAALLVASPSHAQGPPSDFTVTLSGGIFNSGGGTIPYYWRTDGLYGYTVNSKGSGSGSITPHWHWNSTDSPPRAIVVAYKVTTSYSYTKYPGYPAPVTASCTDGFTDRNKSEVGQGGSSNYIKYKVVESPGVDIDLPPFEPKTSIAGGSYTQGQSLGVKVYIGLYKPSSGTNCYFGSGGELQNNIKDVVWKIGSDTVLTYPNAQFPATGNVPSYVRWDSTHYPDDQVKIFDVDGTSKTQLSNGNFAKFEYKEVALTYNKALYVQNPTFLDDTTHLPVITYTDAQPKLSTDMNHATVNGSPTATTKAEILGANGLPKTTAYYSDAHGDKYWWNATLQEGNLTPFIADSYGKSPYSQWPNNDMSSTEISASVLTKNRWQPKLNMALLLNCHAKTGNAFGTAMMFPWQGPPSPDTAFLGWCHYTKVWTANKQWVATFYAQLVLGKTVSQAKTFADGFAGLFGVYDDPYESDYDNGQTDSPLIWGDATTKLHGVYLVANSTDWYILVP